LRTPSGPTVFVASLFTMRDHGSPPPPGQESENDDPKLFQHNYRSALSRDDAPSKHAMG
jgi:hypothetical protein